MLVLRILIFYTSIADVFGAFSCTLGWTLDAIGGKCLIHTGSVYTFYEARETCQGGGGDIVVVESVEERDRINQFLAGSVSSDIWIGVHDPNNDFTYTAVDGTALGTYQPWETDPATEADSSKACAISSYVESGGRVWKTHDCSDKLGTFCEIDATVTPADCDDNWVGTKEEDACIKVIKSTRRNFAGARLYCNRLGGDLATSVTSKGQRSHIMDQLKFRTHLWIAVHSPSQDGMFYYIDGTPVDGTGPFMKGRPSNTGEKHCVTLKMGRWYDKRCRRRFFFVCQKAPNNE